MNDFYETLDALNELVKSRRFKQARDLLIEENHADIAELFEELPESSLVVLFRLLPKETAVDVFADLDSDVQQRIVEGVTDKELAGLVDELFLDDTVDFIEEMPANLVKRVLRNTDAETRRSINQLLKYPENSAGSIMTLEFMELKKDITVATAISDIRANSVEKETIDTCFVTNPQTRNLEGIVTLHNILIANDTDKIEDILDQDIIYAETLEDQEDVADKFKKYDLVSMPVVDLENRLVGVITIDDVLDVIEEETSEDMYRMAAVTPSDDTYLKTSPFNLAKHRILWLLILMISSSITGGIIRNFEEVLSSMVILAAYIPMLMDTGGNAGSQSATMVIRGLALGEIKPRDTLRIIRKEFSVSLMVGVALSVVNFGKLILIDQLAPLVALTVCISLFATVIIAKLCGGLLPVIAEKCKVDPAIMASPLITTIVDTLSLTIYFMLAVSILNIG